MIQSNNWVDKYMQLAKHVSTWSKDPSTQIGAVAVGKDGQILSQGYNGFPRGIHDYQERLDNRELKYTYTVHGEMNVIYNASLNGVSLRDSDLYVYGLPICSECAKGIIQVGIRRVFVCYSDDIGERWKESFTMTRKMFFEADVECHEVK